ncbi:unnamed protein product, partial [Rotaria sp. Silwood1]
IVTQCTLFNCLIMFNSDFQQKYAGRVVQQFSPKEKIALEIIKDLRLFVGGSLREFSNHNSRLPNKLVFS